MCQFWTCGIQLYMLHENFKQSQSVTVFKTKPTLTSFNGPLHHEITDAFRDFTVLMPYGLCC